MLLDLGFHRFAAGLALVIEALEPEPLDGVGDGDDLALGFVEQVARVGATLAARADERDVDLGARGDEAGAAEDVAGHDGEGGGGRGGGSEETPAG
jgi:hypothetical protein